MFTNQLFSTYIILIPGVTWIVTQILKIIICGRLNKAHSWHEMFKSGGMPSAHSSFMTSLTTAIVLKEGYTSSLSILAVGMTAVVMYDAIHVRLESGKHARILNNLHKQTPVTDPKAKKYFPLETSIGHTPAEAFVGGILGIILGALLFFA